MKKIILIPFILFSLNTNAESYRAVCTGNRGKVSISIYSTNGQDEKNKKIILKYNNALGSDDFPFYEGVVTKLSLPYIKVAKKELSVLDHEVIVSWPMNDCQFSKDQPLLFQCNGEGTFLAPQNAPLKSYTLSINHVVEKSLNGSYTIIKMRWGIDSPDFHHSLALPFDPNNCQAEYKLH